MKKKSTKGGSPVFFVLYLNLKSKTIDVSRCLKIVGPPKKAKYVIITDSERVLWRKVEKYPVGSEKILKLNIKKQLFRG